MSTTLSSGNYLVSNVWHNWPLGALGARSSSVPEDSISIYPFPNTTTPPIWKFEQTLSEPSRNYTQGYFKTAGGYLIVEPHESPYHEPRVFTSVATTQKDAALWGISAQYQHGKNVFTVTQKDTGYYTKTFWTVQLLANPQPNYPLVLSGAYSTPSIPPNYASNFLFKFVKAEQQTGLAADGRKLDELD